MENKSFGFIGGGRVVRILLKALVNKGKVPNNVIVSDTNEEVLNKLQKEFPFVKTTIDNTESASCDYVFISLHPPVMIKALEEIKISIKPDAIVISLAPKLTIEKICALLNGFNKIVRMIPNAPTYINEGYNPVSYSKDISAKDKEELKELFELWGEAPEVEEYNLEGYAITTAMGPTYLWFQLSKLHELGKSFGLTEEELEKGIPAMVKGAIDTLYSSGLRSEDVIDLVPVKPLAEFEKTICENYNNSLTVLFNKLKN